MKFEDYNAYLSYLEWYQSDEFFPHVRPHYHKEEEEEDNGEV